MKFIKYLILVLIVLFTIAYLGIKDNLDPLDRKIIEHKIYTIGDKNYEKALKEGKSIVKFGQLFWGLYPGGLAFKNEEKAKQYILKNKNLLDRFSSGWAIFELSGDYLLDTKEIKGQRYLNKSLFIKRVVYSSK